MTFTVSDGTEAASDIVVITVTDVNRPPVLTLDPADPTLRVKEGNPVTITVSASDPDNDSLLYGIINKPADALFDAATGVFTWTPSFGDAADYRVGFTVSDRGLAAPIAAAAANGATQTVERDVVITVTDGQAPTIANLAAAPNPVAVGVPVTVSAQVDDTATGGSNIASASYVLDGVNPVSMTSADGAFDESAETVTVTLTGLAPGVHRVDLSATDVEGNEASLPEPLLIVVYDPNGGFVTGGGWIDSPAGAYSADETLTGRATFGFVAKYQKGMTAPKGETEFAFKAGDLTFRSESYEWLVVTGTTAELQGTGTYNGVSGYHMTLIAVDNGKADTLQFRINDPSGQIVYDTGAGDPPRRRVDRNPRLGVTNGPSSSFCPSDWKVMIDALRIISSPSS